MWNIINFIIYWILFIFDNIIFLDVQHFKIRKKIRYFDILLPMIYYYITLYISEIDPLFSKTK